MEAVLKPLHVEELLVGMTLDLRGVDLGDDTSRQDAWTQHTSKKPLVVLGAALYKVAGQPVNLQAGLHHIDQLIDFDKSQLDIGKFFRHHPSGPQSLKLLCIKDLVQKKTVQVLVEDSRSYESGSLGSPRGLTWLTNPRCMEGLLDRRCTNANLPVHCNFTS